MTTTDDSLAGIASRYRLFAKFEAAGRSSHYERLALFVAESDDALRFLNGFSESDQQPNLFFAALRLTGPLPETEADLTARLNADGPAIGHILKSRSTQTNEPGRCAVLLPLLAQIEGSLALIEVGTSAGLCLYPDRYGYDYGGERFAGKDQLGPVFPCKASANTPLPSTIPDIVWRGGIDLNPLDVTSDDDMIWLTTLVWPGMEDRADRLKQAIKVARQDPPQMVAGNLLTDLDNLIAKAPADATKVVFHTAVLNYVADADDRNGFAERMIAADVQWVSNEHPFVFAHTADLKSDTGDKFALCLNGKLKAWTDPHGKSIDWVG